MSKVSLIILYKILLIFLIILLLPLVLIVSILSFVFDKHNPFYIEKRAGLNGKPFQIIKIKTMKFSHKDNKKIVTKFGKYLRITKIDELPQILNIFLGHMNFVGPRPLYTELFQIFKK